MASGTVLFRKRSDGVKSLDADRIATFMVDNYEAVRTASKTPLTPRGIQANISIPRAIEGLLQDPSLASVDPEAVLLQLAYVAGELVKQYELTRAGN